MTFFVPGAFPINAVTMKLVSNFQCCQNVGLDEYSSPVKLILTYVAHLMNIEPLALYSKCLSASLDLRTSLYAISSMKDGEIADFYRQSKPCADPQFLSCNNWATLRLLSSVSDFNICIYQSKQRGPTLKLVDPRPEHWVLRGVREKVSIAFLFHVCTTERPEPKEPKEPIFGRLSVLERVPDDDVIMGKLIQEIIRPHDDCHLFGLALRLLNENIPETVRWDQAWKQHEVIYDVDKANEAMEKIGTFDIVMIVLVKGRKCALRWEKLLTSKPAQSPQDYNIMLLGMLNYESEHKISKENWQRVKVIAPRIHGGWYLLNDSFSAHCRELFSPPEYEPRSYSVRPIKSVRGGGKKRDPVAPERLAVRWKEKLEKERRMREERGKEESEENEEGAAAAAAAAAAKEACGTFTRCPCDVCTAAVKLYGKNMKLRGPQKLYKKDFDLEFSFSLCNLWDKDLKKRFDLCLQLSYSAMDIESSTVNLDDRCFDINLEPEKRDLNWQNVSETPIIDEERKNMRLQRLCMIGHVDYFSPMHPYREVKNLSELSIIEENACKIFHRGSRTEQELVDEYARFILERKKQMSDLKYELLAKEFAVLAAYKDAHEEYFKSKGIEGKKCIDAWKFSFLGRVESKMRKLVNLYCIFSFNGQNYDMVLLAPFLASSSHLTSEKCNIMRRGSSVPRITFRNQLIFTDLCNLISPGTSLAKFAKSVGIKTPKALFPYEMLDEKETFLDQTSLPSDPAAYWSDLTRTKPSEREVLEAIELFNKKKFTTVREYLVYYLKVDLGLLLVSMQRYFTKSHELNGVHVMDAMRFTIAGFSDSLAQLHLVKTKRIGGFSVNNPYYFNVLKRSLLGGISKVCRTNCNFGDLSEVPCNSHLEDCDPEQLEMDDQELRAERQIPRSLIYLDVASLYCHSVKYARYGLCFVFFCTASQTPTISHSFFFPFLFLFFFLQLCGPKKIMLLSFSHLPKYHKHTN